MIEQDGWTLFPMQNGTVLDLFEPDSGMIPEYGLNDGLVFGFRVDDIGPRPPNSKLQVVSCCARFIASPR